MKEDIGIGIIDVYSQLELTQCLESVPKDLQKNIFLVSNTKNKSVLNIPYYRFDREVSFASMRNRILSHFRLQNKKFLFLMFSNFAITENTFFEDAVKTASNFGTWCMTGPGSNSFSVEDDEKRMLLQITPELNAGVMFLHTNIVKKYGYFNEQLHSNNQLEVLDYIIRLRKDGLYPPNHFNPSLERGLYKSVTKLNKITNNEDRINQLSFGMFHHLHNYIPGHDDPVGVSQEILFKSVESIQQKYARPL